MRPASLQLEPQKEEMSQDPEGRQTPPIRESLPEDETRPLSPWEVNTYSHSNYPQMSGTTVAQPPFPACSSESLSHLQVWTFAKDPRIALLCGVLVAPANWYPGDRFNTSLRGHPNGLQPKHQEAVTSLVLRSSNSKLKPHNLPHPTWFK